MKLNLFLSILFMFSTANAELNIYSDRPAEKMQVMIDAYTAKTGEKVNFITLKWAEMKPRLIKEGSKTPADLIIVKDLVFLNEATEAGLLQKLNSTFVKENVDASMQSPFWTALTYRARTLVYDKSFDVSEINTYEDLASPKYAGKLCLRTSKSSYNQALAASLINSYGVEKTTEIFDGWLNNLADFTKIHKSDTNIIKDIALQNKTCTLGITNSYYLGLQLLQNPNIPVGIKFLSLNDGGVSTNGIGIGITASSQKSQEATRFIEIMLSQEVQEYFSTANQDFPANKNMKFPKNIQGWGGFEVSAEKWNSYSDKIKTAKEIFAEVDYQ